MTISVAFFLSSSGDLIHVPHNHISTVIADPEKFGLTKEEIQTVYDLHGERIGVEGAARKELLLKVITQGWIRLRRYPNRYWSITAPCLTAGVHEHLRDWATQMLSGIHGFKEIVHARENGCSVYFKPNLALMRIRPMQYPSADGQSSENEERTKTELTKRLGKPHKWPVGDCAWNPYALVRITSGLHRADPS
jgi:hypothetical protein